MKMKKTATKAVAMAGACALIACGLVAAAPQADASGGHVAHAAAKVVKSGSTYKKTAPGQAALAKGAKRAAVKVMACLGARNPGHKCF